MVRHVAHPSRAGVHIYDTKKREDKIVCLDRALQQHDPQLEKAIELARDALKKVPTADRPAYPIKTNVAR